jgi:hypothetical protein
VKHERTFTLPEVIELGFEACHVTEDGASWLFHGCWALRSDPLRGTRMLVMDAAALPGGPWHLTAWGEAELRRSQADERG